MFTKTQNPELLFINLLSPFNSVNLIDFIWRPQIGTNKSAIGGKMYNWGRVCVLDQCGSFWDYVKSKKWFALQSHVVKCINWFLFLLLLNLLWSHFAQPSTHLIKSRPLRNFWFQIWWHSEKCGAVVGHSGIWVFSDFLRAFEAAGEEDEKDRGKFTALLSAVALRSTGDGQFQPDRASGRRLKKCKPM